jgi:hypothetical protein
MDAVMKLVLLTNLCRYMRVKSHKLDMVNVDQMHLRYRPISAQFTRPPGNGSQYTVYISYWVFNVLKLSICLLALRGLPIFSHSINLHTFAMVIMVFWEQLACILFAETDSEETRNLEALI